MGEVSEDELLAAARAGRVLDCGDADALGRVDAVLLRRCCQELKGLIDRRGIRLRRAEIMGCADLSGLEIPFSLRFAECAFDEPLVVEGAQLFELCRSGVTLTCRGHIWIARTRRARARRRVPRSGCVSLTSRLSQFWVAGWW